MTLGGGTSKEYEYQSTGNALINYASVEGKYNVGGIVGSAADSVRVQNVQNQAQVLATGYTTEDYIFHTDYSGYNKNTDGTYSIKVRMANAGGIVGSADGSNISEAINRGDVLSQEVAQTEGLVAHYGAGNVGGIVGRAYNTNITNVTNKESNIRGAMNVGGIAGYFGSADTTSMEEYVNSSNIYSIANAKNEGGDILATGGVGAEDGTLVREATRKNANEGVYEANNEFYYIGNIGGIAGYLDGNMARVHTANNNGTVHTEYDTDKVTAQAANVGGIVGKMDTAGVGGAAARLEAIKKNEVHSMIYASTNSGHVQGYANIGGVTGFAYNGSIADSYNSGNITTSRMDASAKTPINMGGILGDSTEIASGRTVLYNVGNKGQIGSSEAISEGNSSYKYKGRHVGGIVGRLSGIVEKAYNDGAIYNGSSVVGGVAGYWYAGNIKNVYNTGNITVDNQNSSSSQVGGIVGTAAIAQGDDTGSASKAMSITNAYNIGTLRAFKNNGAGNDNIIGGIVGQVVRWDSAGYDSINISNVYTGGNLWANNGKLGGIVGWSATKTYNQWAYNINLKNAYFIAPSANSDYPSRLDNKGVYNGSDSALKNSDGSLAVQYIANADRYDKSKYNFSFSTQEGGTVSGATDDNWRIYEGSSLPLLNAFLPWANEYFGNSDNWNAFKENNANGSVQYGTAYNPLLTIVNTAKNLSFDWHDLNLGYNGSLAVKGLGLASDTNYKPYVTLQNVQITNGTGSYSGTIYSDGQLILLGQGYNETDADGSADLKFGYESKLYGSSVTIKTGGQLELAGSIVATGNQAVDGMSDEEKAKLGINLEAGELNVYGSLTTAEAGKLGSAISGLASQGDFTSKIDVIADIQNKQKNMHSVGDRYAQTMTHAANYDGNLNIVTKKNAVTGSNGSTSGQANVLYGNLGRGQVTNHGGLNITSEGDIVVDTDLRVDGKITLLAAEDAAPIEIQLDLSNIGGAVSGNAKAQAVQDFMTAHSSEDTMIIASNNKAETAKYDGLKLLFDMWDDAEGAFDESKYDVKGDDGTTTSSFTNKLQDLKIKANEWAASGKDLSYILIENAEQLNGIQAYAEGGTTDDEKKAHQAILKHSFVLKNDIDASVLGDDYKSIGRGETAFTGILDGNGKNILGLKAQNGLITNLGNNALVTNLNIYSSVFVGSENASVGAVCGTTSYGSTIDNVTGFGNTITAEAGSTIGGLVGTNGGAIQNVSDQSTVIAVSGITAGGIAGSNDYSGDLNATDIKMLGSIENAQSNSAVTTRIKEAGQYAQNLGGIVGVNKAHALSQLGENLTVDIDNVSSHGVTGKAGSTKTSGGIVGENNGTITNAYNESVIHGSENIGGIAGLNHSDGSVQGITADGSVQGITAELDDIANGLAVLGDANSTNVGGLVGQQLGEGTTVNNGRNTGIITGGENVGGMVGKNNAGSYLNNLENALQATITGNKNVGGIAGYNAGSISSTDDKLLNSGSIYGVQNVGGVVGYNLGLVENVSTDITLHVRTATDSTEAQNFGGIVGFNDVLTDSLGTVEAAGQVINATNNGRVVAESASYVGGIIGKNTNSDAFVKKDDQGTVVETKYTNLGSIIGGNYVGGIVGSNEPVRLANIEAVNKGDVTATKGGAGGIFGKYKGSIRNSTLVNEGNVVGKQNTIDGLNAATGGITGVLDGAITGSTIINRGSVSIDGGYGNNIGGLFGVSTSTSTITGSTLQNEGAVAGTQNVGGLFGQNNSTISTSNLINTVTGTVQGNENVGGLIGYNTGTVEGGRDEDNNYYKYKVYNNGVITAINGGENFGGLIGNNAGNLTAAYNTGTVDVSSDNSINVGGIAGVNSGTIDQVFNSVVVATPHDDKTAYTYTSGSITGGTKVGGIVGYNKVQRDDQDNVINGTGVISNAYNTTAVNGSEASGNVVGTSDGGRVRNVYGYASSTTGGKNIASSSDTDVYCSYVIDANGKLADDKDAKSAASYDGFDFAGDDENDAVWKLYATNTNPLLKVFLTKMTVTDAVYKDLVYNAADQLLVDKWIADSKLTTVAADAFNAYKNNNVLISGKELKNAGTYNNWLWSGQIAADAQGQGDTLLGPNNLGYDFDVTDITINKKQLSSTNVTANDVQRTYGTVGGVTYSLSFNYGNDFNDAMKAELQGKVTLKESQETIQNSKDGAVVDGGTRTNNVGSYSWSGTAGIDESIAGNYEFANGASTSAVQAKSDVTKAQLVINLNDISRTYGDLAAKDYSNEYTFVEGNGLVNGDSGLVINANSDGAIAEGTVSDVQKTSNAGGTYTWSGTAGGVANLNNNYDVTINTGNSNVTKAQLKIVVDDKTIFKGETVQQYTGSFSGLVNGDSDDVINIGGYDLDSSVDPAVIGTYTDKIGVLIGTNLVFAGSDISLTNYNVVIDPGTLTVTENYVPPVPQDDYWFSTAPWDKERNLRERKAEFHYIDGGMNL